MQTQSIFHCHIRKKKKFQRFSSKKKNHRNSSNELLDTALEQCFPLCISLTRLFPFPPPLYISTLDLTAWMWRSAYCRLSRWWFLTGHDFHSALYGVFHLQNRTRAVSGGQPKQISFRVRIMEENFCLNKTPILCTCSNPDAFLFKIPVKDILLHKSLSTIPLKFAPTIFIW